MSAVLRQIPATRRPWRYLYARGTPPALIPTENAPMAGVGDGRTERVQSLCGPLDLTARAPDDRINRLLIAAEGQKNAAVDDGVAARIEVLATDHNWDPVFEDLTYTARGMVEKAVLRQTVDRNLAFRAAQRFGDGFANEPENGFLRRVV